MAYVPPHLRGETARASSPPPQSGISRRPPPYPHTPQPQRAGGSRLGFSRSETPTFSTRGSRGVIRNRWARYVDSRSDPERKQKREAWLKKTQAEREKLADDPTQTYDSLKIDVEGNNLPTTTFETFADIDLGEELDRNILKAGYASPMPVQRATIPIVLANRDLMSCAQTGSGKTAAFLFPIISMILQNPPSNSGNELSHRITVFPQALILCPTRELGQQIHEEAVRFCEGTPVRPVVIYGGVETYGQIQEMGQGCDILVATPGRLWHFIDRKVVCLSNVAYLVIDEADRMLDLGFVPQIRQIVEDPEMPDVDHRQTMMFSATFPHTIQRLAADFLKDYVFITVGKEGSTVDSIDQKILWVEESEKKEAIMDVFKDLGERKTVIFVETKRGADQLERFLDSQGLSVDSIHGDRSQSERDYSLKQFRDGKTLILVATDVASRGLDISDIELVVNYDMPQEIESYVHRIGRTGRAGKTGIAVTFLNDKSAQLIPALIDVLENSHQTVPDWLHDQIRSFHGFHRGGRRPQSRRNNYNRRYDRRGSDRGDFERSYSTPVRSHFDD